MIDIDISDALLHPGTEYDFEFEGETGFEAPDLAHPVEIRAKYAAEGGTVRVRGVLRSEMTVNCSRCLRETLLPVEEDFEEVFVERQDDGDAYAFSRDAKRLSLDPMVRDLLLTSVPIQVLCSEDCRGLCPECGMNLNDGSCSCGERDFDKIDELNPFAKLKDLF